MLPSKIALEKSYVYCPPQLLDEIDAHAAEVTQNTKCNKICNMVENFYSFKTSVLHDQNQMYSAVGHS